jgi:hypothetical protein
MLWLFIVGFLCALYEVLMGFLGIFFVDVWDDTLDWFILRCTPGIRGQGHGTVWRADTGVADLFVTLHTVVIIMWSMIHYIVFFTIPYRYNRILKTDKEVI